MVDQLSSQIQEDLKTLKITTSGTKTDWNKWCGSLSLSESEYTLSKENGKIICHSNNEKLTGSKIDEIEAEEIKASIKLQPDLILTKTIPLVTLQKSMETFDRVLFLRIVPFAFLSYLIFILLFYRYTRPLGTILSKVEKFKADIPFHRSMKMLYQKDEWGEIEEALIKADQRLQFQIQEVKLENEKNAAILESINDDIIAIDRYESILFFNSKFEKNFMIRRPGQEINRKIWHIFNSDVLDSFRAVLKSGKASSLKGIKNPTSHRSDRYYDLTITPLKSANGTISGVLGVFYDVTEFKLTEQMRVDFVANVSHEIRTPLTSIKGFTQILQGQKDKLDIEIQPFMDKIVANTERMISLFNDLLNLSVIESKNEIKKEEIIFEEIIEMTRDTILASFPDLEISFITDIQQETILGDYRLIEQVILNLSDNACKYAKEIVELAISTHRTDKFVQITIKDNGPGIPEEHLPRIFERFYRVDASRESLRGTGLGLSIVKQIVQKHKGIIWAERNVEGMGTTFIIQLPLE